MKVTHKRMLLEALFFFLTRFLGYMSFCFAIFIRKNHERAIKNTLNANTLKTIFVVFTFPLLLNSMIGADLFSSCAGCPVLRQTDLDLAHG